MKRISLLFAAVVCVTNVISAQSVAYKSKDGFTFLSKTEGQYFTIDIHGVNITPIDPKSSPHPYFNVDGRFLQVLVVRMDEFKGEASKGAEANLKTYFNYEKNYWKEKWGENESGVQKLASGRAAMVWSFAPSKELREMAIKQGNKTPASSNEMVSLVSHNYVLTLGSDVSGKDTRKAVREFLLKIADSFFDSDSPMELKFFPDGQYERHAEAGTK